MAMRITNSMITMHSKTNINGTKNLTDKYNGQMTSQKKIDKPSDDPVVAIRSLRLRDSLHEVEQYTDKNIPDAESWLKVTETSLNNMGNVFKDIYTLCVNGSTGTLTTDDRNIILSNLSAYVDQIYSEGNTEYAGRTIFTGYKTNKTLTFQEATEDAYYRITDRVSVTAIDKKCYQTNILNVPNSATDLVANVPDVTDEIDNVYNYRMRLAYDNLDKVTDTGADLVPKIVLRYIDPNTGEETVLNNDNSSGLDIAQQNIAVMSYAEFISHDAEINGMPGAPSAVFLYDTGEIVLNTDIVEVGIKHYAEIYGENNIVAEVEYYKKGFDKGEVRPEMYFDCKDLNTGIEFEREVQDINYTVAGNQELNVNTQAGQDGILSTAIGRDIKELMDAVTASQKANEKKTRIEAMIKDPMYAGDDYQKAFATWLEAINKEVDYTTENLRSVFSKGITKFQDYKQTTELAKTDVGSRSSRLELTKTRMTAQKASLQELIHSNEDRELSDILIDYETANLAYQSSLKAASEINQMTLLTYL